MNTVRFVLKDGRSCSDHRSISAAEHIIGGVAPPASLGDLARRREILEGATTCGEVERIFAAHRRWGSLVIRRANGSLTILDRDRFMAQMAGELGYGRALYDRQPVERLAGDGPVLALNESSAGHGGRRRPRAVGGPPLRGSARRAR